jgi:hypothetical protein
MIRVATMLAGLVAGAALATGPTMAASASPTPQPFSLSVSPGRLAAGEPGSTRLLTLANNGTEPVTVRAELSELSQNAAGQCAVGPLGELTWATVTPSSLTLPPGGRQTATVTIASDVPAGMHDLVTAFVAVPGGGSGVTVSGAVGAQMQVRGNGQAAIGPCVSLPAASNPVRVTAATPTTAHGAMWTWVVLGVALLALIAATPVVRRIRRRATPMNAPEQQ